MASIKQQLDKVEKKVYDFDIYSLNTMSDDITSLNASVLNLTNSLTNIRSDFEKYKSTQHSTYSHAVSKSPNPLTKTNPLQNKNTQSSSKTNVDKPILFFMDSNAKILDFKRLWDPSITKLINTFTLNDLRKNIQSHITQNTKCVVINVGTNDIDKKSPHEITDEVDQILETIFELNGNVKVILSEILPRSSKKADMDVISINEFFRSEFRGYSNIFLLNQDKFRRFDNFFLVDDKHLHREAAPIFAGSFRFALKNVMKEHMPSTQSSRNSATNTVHNTQPLEQQIKERIFSAIESCFNVF